MSKKKCSSCQEEKPLDDYYNRKSAKDGKFSECKDCHKSRYRAWLQTEKGRAYSRRKNRERYHKKKDDPDFIEQRRAKDRAYYEKNRDRKLQAVKEYQANKKAEDELQSIISSNPAKYLSVLKITQEIVDLLCEGNSELETKLEELKDTYTNIDEAKKDKE